MAPVLEDARKLGYAEADPSADIDGDDAGAKLVVLGGHRVPPAPAPVRHPAALDPADQRRRLPLREAPRLHHPPDRDGRSAETTASTPSSVPRSSRATRASAATRAPTTSSRSSASSAGRAASAAPAPAGPATAVAVVSDLLALAAQRATASTERNGCRARWCRRRPARITSGSSSTTGPASWRRLPRRWPGRTSTSTPCCRNPATRRMRCRS